MRFTKIIAVLAVLVAMAVFVADASAMYHPGMGRFMQRDPGASGPMRVGASGSHVAGGSLEDGRATKPVPRLGGYGSGTAHIRSKAHESRSHSPHAKRVAPHNQYADGLNLYLYVGSMPTCKRDPSGLYAGITVHRAPVAKREDGTKDVGHEWIEIKGGPSYGFYPSGSIWGSDGEVHSPDPHEGERTGTSWETVKVNSLPGLFYGKWDYYMYEPYLVTTWLGRTFTRAKKVGCCKDKNAKDVKACIKTWAEWADKHWEYSLHERNCSDFVRLVLPLCCLQKEGAQMPRAEIER